MTNRLPPTRALVEERTATAIATVRAAREVIPGGARVRVDGDMCRVSALVVVPACERYGNADGARFALVGRRVRDGARFRVVVTLAEALAMLVGHRLAV